MTYDVDQESLNHKMFNKLVISAPSAPDWFIKFYLDSLLKVGCHGLFIDMGRLKEGEDCDLELAFDGRMDAEAEWKIRYAHAIVLELIHQESK